MRSLWMLLVASLLTGTAWAQGGGAPPAAAPAQQAADEQQQLEALLRDMGAGPEEITMVRLLGAAEDMDPMQVMLLMGLMDGGHMDEGFLLFLLPQLNKGGGVQPTVIMQGERMLIVDERQVRIVNVTTGTVENTITYKPRRPLTEILAELAPLIAEARGRQEQAQAIPQRVAVATPAPIREGCAGNLQQLGVAVQMYAADQGGMLPDGDWVTEVQPYSPGGPQGLVCPNRPDLPTGYAMNEALLGRQLNEIRQPHAVVLFFESDLGGEAPVGGADALCQAGPHDGKVYVCFLDGHTALLTLEEARNFLQRPVE